MKGAIFALFLLSNNWNFFPNISNITTNRHIYYIYMRCERFKLAIEEGTAKIQRWHTLGGWKRRAQAHNALEGWLCSLFKTKKCGVWFRRWKEKRNGSCSCWTASCPTPWRSRPHRCYSTIERLWFSRRIKKRCDNYQIWSNDKIFSKGWNIGLGNIVLWAIIYYTTSLSLKASGQVNPTQSGTRDDASYIGRVNRD